MRRLLLSLCALIVSVGIAVPQAEAKRLGSSRSIGMQRQAVPPRTPPTAPSAQPSQGLSGAAAQQPRRSGWLGPVAGLAAGLGLAALASHLGLGAEFGNILLIALLAMGALLVFRLLMRRRAPAPAMQYAGMSGGGGATPFAGQTMSATASTPAAASAPATAAPFPPGFDADGFARQAKANFLRLQAANDAGNLDDLREFLTPEMFAEAQLDLSDRGPSKQNTEVLELHAEVLECVEEARRYIASVRFHGLVREEANAAPVDFDEVWHLTKPVDGSRGWAVAGIQQRQ